MDSDFPLVSQARTATDRPPAHPLGPSHAGCPPRRWWEDWRPPVVSSIRALCVEVMGIDSAGNLPGACGSSNPRCSGHPPAKGLSLPPPRVPALGSGGSSPYAW